MTAQPEVAETDPLTPVSTPLLDKVRELAHRRAQHLQHAKDSAQRMYDFQEAHPAFFSAMAQEKAALDVEKDLVAALESDVKSLTLEAFRETGNKKPAPGTEIKLFTVLAYDLEKAFAWAKPKGIAIVPECLNTETFEALVKAMKPETLADAGLAFVAVNEEPRPQLAKDLDKALSIAEVTK